MGLGFKVTLNVGRTLETILFNNANNILSHVSMNKKILYQASSLCGLPSLNVISIMAVVNFAPAVFDSCIQTSIFPFTGVYPLIRPSFEMYGSMPAGARCSCAECGPEVATWPGIWAHKPSPLCLLTGRIIHSFIYLLSREELNDKLEIS